MYMGIAALNLALAVMLGAFGAHGLKAHASAEQLAWWHTSTQYFFFHALGLLVLGLVMLSRPQITGLAVPYWSIQLGILIFCGSLFAMALGAPRWFGAITPIGGVLMIIGWLLLAWWAFRVRAI